MSRKVHKYKWADYHIIEQMSPPRSINNTVSQKHPLHRVPLLGLMPSLPTPPLTRMHLGVSWCPGAQELGFVRAAVLKCSPTPGEQGVLGPRESPGPFRGSTQCFS